MPEKEGTAAGTGEPGLPYGSGQGMVSRIRQDLPLQQQVREKCHGVRETCIACLRAWQGGCPCLHCSVLKVLQGTVRYNSV